LVQSCEIVIQNRNQDDDEEFKSDDDGYDSGNQNQNEFAILDFVLGPGSGTCLMKVEGIAPNFIKFIYKSGDALYRFNPWKCLKPCHFFGVRVGKDSDGL